MRPSGLTPRVLETKVKIMATRKRTKSLDDINSQWGRILMNSLQNSSSRNSQLARRATDIVERYANNILATRSQKNHLKKEGRPFEVMFGDSVGETTQGGWRRKYTGYQDKSTTRAVSLSKG